MSDAPIANPFANLRQAFVALEKSEVKSPHGDVRRCVSLIHLRDLAVNAGLTTFAESRHLKNCRKCSVRLSTMQFELGMDPTAKFKRALAHDQRDLARFAEAEKCASHLFHRLHAHRGDPDRSFIWSEIHSTVQALRRHHSPGEEEDAKAIIVMTSTALRCALADALTPFAHNLDASWPVVFMLEKTGVEASRHRDGVVTRFAAGYAEIVHSAPAPLKAALTYGIGKFLERGPQLERIANNIMMRLVDDDNPETRAILTMLSEARTLKARPQTDPYITSINISLSDLAERLRARGDLSGIISTVQIKTCELLTKTLLERDATLKLRHLLLTRHYLSSAASQINKRWPNTIDRFSYMGDIVSDVMRNARYADNQYFVATEIISAIDANSSAIRFMTDQLETPDDSLRQALFVYFLELIGRSPAAAPFRFVGRGNSWVFEGEAGCPISIFGSRAAAMAKEDPEIAALVEWSQLHESCTDAVREQPIRA